MFRVVQSITIPIGDQFLWRIWASPGLIVLNSGFLVFVFDCNIYIDTKKLGVLNIKHVTISKSLSLRPHLLIMKIVFGIEKSQGHMVLVDFTNIIQLCNHDEGRSIWSMNP